jgi:hypothetical protein
MLQVSVGRLGIITKVKFPIVPQQAVKRSLDIMTVDTFVEELLKVETAYVEAVAANSSSAIAEALRPLDEVQVSPS